MELNKNAKKLKVVPKPKNTIDHSISGTTLDIAVPFNNYSGNIVGPFLS